MKYIAPSEAGTGTCVWNEEDEEKIEKKRRKNPVLYDPGAIFRRKIYISDLRRKKSSRQM
jgi:hypothetical protein